LDLFHFDKLSEKDFEERNEAPTDIVGGFDVYANIEMVKVKGEIKEFLIEAKKNFLKRSGWF
jgi:hypothetical protein